MLQFLGFLLFSCSFGAYGALATGALQIWLQIVLRCSLDSVLVSPTVGFDLTSISAPLAVVVLFLVYCCKGFFVGVREGLMNLLRVVPLLVPLGCIGLGTPLLVAISLGVRTKNL